MRVRECESCGKRFKTFESTEDMIGRFNEIKRRLMPVLEIMGK